MTNMIPQSAANNRGVWSELEKYSRELAREGKTLYIIAGGDGQLKTLANGKVSVPANTWKVAVVLDSPNASVTETTRVIAVRIPNTQAVANTDWRDYRVSVDEIEKVTGLDLLSNIPKNVQANESFNELVVQALKQELRRRKAVEAHETILKIRSSVKQRTGFHPDPVPLIRQLREGEER